jgi:ParB/RepB/Spo0J family partition protein
MDTIYDVEIKDIDVSPLNVRVENTLTDIEELAASIEKHGLLQPVVLLGSLGQKPYQLIAGQRRLLAHKRIAARNKGKPKTIRAVFVGNLSAEQSTLRSLVENLQRVDLNHADTAKAITTLYKKYGNDERKVQRETGLSIQRVRDYIAIEAQASPEMKRKLAQKKVTIVDVKRAITASLGNVEKAERILTLMEKYPLNKHQKKRVVEYAVLNRHATAEKIIEEARKPRVEESIMVSLPLAVRLGLEKATKKLSKEAEEIVSDVLEQWLNEQGFIKGQ